MMIALYVVAAVIMSVGSLYLAWRNREFKEEHAPSAALRLLRRLPAQLQLHESKD